MSALNGVLLSEHVGVARILRVSDSALRLFRIWSLWANHTDYVAAIGAQGMTG